MKKIVKTTAISVVLAILMFMGFCAGRYYRCVEKVYDMTIDEKVLMFINEKTSGECRVVEHYYIDGTYEIKYRKSNSTEFMYYYIYETRDDIDKYIINLLYYA